MNLEERLRHALRRVEPDEDFAASVLARLDAAEVRRPSPARWHAPRWALAASVLIAIGVGFFVHQQRERERVAVAGQQLAYALELTSRELQNIRQHIEHSTEEKGS